jgi:hypothetical protein
MYGKTMVFVEALCCLCYEPPQAVQLGHRAPSRMQSACFFIHNMMLRRPRETEWAGCSPHLIPSLGFPLGIGRRSLAPNSSPSLQPHGHLMQVPAEMDGAGVLPAPSISAAYDGPGRRSLVAWSIIVPRRLIPILGMLEHGSLAGCILGVGRCLLAPNSMTIHRRPITVLRQSPKNDRGGVFCSTPVILRISSWSWAPLFSAQLHLFDARHRAFVPPSCPSPSPD